MAEEPKILPYKPFPSFIEWSESTEVPISFDGTADSFVSLKDQFGPKSLRAATTVATKWAAVDTGAIEGLYDVERGFTFTIALNTSAWDDLHKMKGDAVAQTIHDAMEAYEYVLDIATNSRPVTQVWIRELHATICASQATYVVYTDDGPRDRSLSKGEYKKEFNSPLNLESNEIHGYASPNETPSEMDRLVSELNSEPFLRAHPIAQAAYAHYAFVCVHPFPDGNGRVSRALASIYLYRRPGVPLVIFADQKPEYITSLERADAGDFQAFTRFISDRATDTMGMIKSVLDSTSKPSIQDQVKAAKEMLVGRGGITHPEFDALGLRMVEALEAAFLEVISEARLELPLSARIQRHSGGSAKSLEGYRVIPQNPLWLGLTVSSAAPFNSEAARSYSLVVARPDTDGPDFIVRSNKGGRIPAEQRELSPTVSAPLQFRLRTVAEGELGELLAQVIADADQQLRSQGYAN